MPRKSPQERLIDVVTSARVASPFEGLSALESFGAGVTVEPWMITELREAEASIRRLRREMEQRLSGTGGRRCAGCGQALTATRSDARYCSGRCRQAALRTRQGDG